MRTIIAMLLLVPVTVFAGECELFGVEGPTFSEPRGDETRYFNGGGGTMPPGSYRCRVIQRVDAPTEGVGPEFRVVSQNILSSVQRATRENGSWLVEFYVYRFPGDPAKSAKEFTWTVLGEI